VADDGAWVVVQQGMNPERRQARRYHWLWERAGSFVDDPHAAIEGRPVGDIVNLVDRRAAPARAAALAVAGEERHLTMPAHHDVRAADIDLARLGRTLAAVREQGPRDFAELLLVPGVGARTLFALALVAEVIHGAPIRFADPARFSLAHGGKDGHPFPVPLRVYDQTIRVLKQAMDRAALGHDERLGAIRQLDAQARNVDRLARDPSPADLARWVAAERADGPVLGARSVGGGRAVAARRPERQLSLPFTPAR
jgi:hypothetical protein